MSGVDDGESAGGDTTEDEDSHIERALRGGAGRVIERKRKLDEDRERKEQQARQPKGSKAYERVLKKIADKKTRISELDDKIVVVDNDLREADCPRTKCLGKDRFCNRYWWFERNAMPYEGLPTSSTAEAHYANGRLWVQGPDEMERTGFIDVPDDLKKAYRKEFKMTPVERRKIEEGPTILADARSWGYYDDAEAVDKLIEWLDPRGNRELKLQKELSLHRDLIVKYMKNRADYLTENAENAERAESEEVQPRRVATRHKTYVNDAKHRCLQWRNTTAKEENGHLHVDPPKLVKRAKKESAKDNTRDTRSRGRALGGRPFARQGTRYDF